jgi:hypothetical protein
VEWSLQPGIWNYGIIFEDALMLNLEFGERCETDAGYRGSAPENVKCPGETWGENTKHGMQQKVRSRQETMNERLKNWAILTTPYRHDLCKHQTVCVAVIMLLQLQLSLEHNPLFSVEYND